ncbi:ribonuclease Z [Robiginitalea marina]|uniref:Ribonuclease Z n=1 Tax=Robiginitalea marina TaxID=2954105 RepID=A0ABT1AX82_9FLAO|nr:ribonuclease Z [Robiginitalea marina]MCO5723808.1 ribonuclease Z [Robiginitalea marina]
MIFDKEGNTTIVIQERTSLPTFLANLEEAYPRLRDDHLIINLSALASFRPRDVRDFLELSNRHRGRGKSFVLVSETIPFDEVPEEMNLVPTLQEARDIIEMEDIERDLDL